MTSGELCKRLREQDAGFYTFQAAERIEQLEAALTKTCDMYVELYVGEGGLKCCAEDGIAFARAALKETPAGGISEADKMKAALEEIASGLSVRLPYDIANEALGRTPAEEHHG